MPWQQTIWMFCPSSWSSGVQITGFGTFESKHRKARQGRNPRTGQTIQIAATNTPAASKPLRLYSTGNSVSEMPVTSAAARTRSLSSAGLA